MIKIYEPYLNKKNLEYAHDAINSGWISSQGKYISKTTNKLKEILKTDNVLLVSNGTTATHCISKSINYKFPKIKKLIVPNNSYVAAWNAFLFDSYYNEILSVDACIKTWNYDLGLLYTELRNSDLEQTALLCVHNLGNIINIPQIRRKFPNLIVVEDNCEGLFGKYEGHYSGTKCFASSVSFFANKTITSGEGGAFLCEDRDTFEYISSFINQGNTGVKFIHDKIAQNYRMTNIQAAILLGQLEDIEYITERKKSIFDKYREAFGNMKNVKIQMEETNTEFSNWMMGVKFLNNLGYQYYKKELHNSGIETRPMFFPYEAHSHLKDIIVSKKNTVAKHLNETCIMIPSHPNLKDEEVEYIISKIKQINC